MMKKYSLIGVAVLGLFAQPALAEDLVFDLINASSLDLVALHISPTGAESWGDDVLGMDTLNAGESGEVTIADGEDVCDYDMSFEMSDGTELEGSADLCANNSFTLTN